MRIAHALILSALVVPSAIAQYKYPVTKKIEHTDTYFGKEISDPYHWLEDDHAPETKEWVIEQNKVTEQYLASIPYRQEVKKRLTKLWNFPKSGSPFKGGNNYYVYTNNGLQNQFVLNIIKGGHTGTPQVFVDPNALSKEGTANMSTVTPSHDGKYVAYMVANAGSDWQNILVKDSTGKDLTDKVEWVKFSGISWQGDGFYYSRYDKPDEAALLKGKNENHKVYYHKIGTEQSRDSLVFQDKEHPLRNVSAEVTDEQDYLFVDSHEGSAGNNLLAKNLKTKGAPFKTLVEKMDKKFGVVDNDGSKIYVLTNDGASNYRLVMMDAENPSTPWKDIIPAGKEVLQGITVADNKFVAQYMKDATSVLRIYSREGKFEKEIPLESIGTVDQVSGSKKSSHLFYALTTFTSPSVIYMYDMKSGKQVVFFQPKTEFDSKNYVTEQVFFTSKDGTKVPMFIVHKKDIVRNGDNPTLVYGYGGFNVPQLPIFKMERAVFLENGGVFALPSLRGGGEYGEDWHKAGTGLQKQNVFDDFIAAAEYLIKEKWTNSSKLAMNGRSNGGLLVGAVMTQRPELFKVAIPTVGVMDMLRYHTFTIGWAWKTDYGSSEDEANFKNLLAYSPLHNLKPAEYPATLVTTGDHDDRVVPAHSFKFISALQENNKGTNPVMIRIDMNAGHASTTALGSSKPVAKQIDEMTDIFSFIMYNLGVKTIKN